MMKFWAQAVFNICVLFGVALVTWYEGSAIRMNPWEWKYSAHFSQMFHGEVHTETDILAIDHFIYAAKFKPFFPLIMAGCILHLIVLTGFGLLKKEAKKPALYLSLLGVSLFICSGIVFQSPASGLKLFSAFFLITGIACILMALLIKSPFYQNRISEKFIS
ncbi:DUF4306 domain-containing protein [Halobacillus litoralis]|uniref:DUF4306 domain-containing protein n=1 Tax=Halobacillus litoralis TaxID=45668 RepID=UPI0024924A5E|nr:DUF4306 domain-containing protein [Halobacillus litoralis]